ncbi:hypothetical protein [Noviluteimonas dokdonensis]|uniref:hypothetical protein n=1 Tax=Noviluteimonas dokdonensis TaxID=414050 RepID=UPI00126A4BDA|nr:hypothetical protein [Lysobacter dokdonensis]
MGLLAMVAMEGQHSLLNPAAWGAAVVLTIFLAPLAFVVGVIPALLAGLVALGWEARWPTRSAWRRLLRDVSAGLVGGAPWLFSHPRETLLGVHPMVTFCVIAAVVCGHVNHRRRVVRTLPVGRARIDWKRLAGTILLFVLLAPLVGYLSLTVIDHALRQQAFTSRDAMGLIFGMPLAYFVGSVAAIATALSTHVLDVRWPKRPVWSAMLFDAGFGATTMACAAVSLMHNKGQRMMLLAVVAGAIAAVVCGLLNRMSEVPSRSRRGALVNHTS